MEEIINEIFSEGDKITLLFTNSTPYKGNFVKCGNGCIVVKGKTGKTVIMRVEDIMRVIRHDAEPQAEYAAEDISEVDIPEDNEGATIVIEQSETGDEIFEIERPASNIKIVGKVNLDEVDPRRRERIKRLPHTAPEINESEVDDNGIKIVPMGKVSSIGQKFGFIDTGTETLYFNIGEVMKGWQGEEDLQKDDEVVFTLSRNARGTVAKCIHRPWSISRQLQIIDRIAYRDMRNARLLSMQLKEAFPEDEQLLEELYSMRMI